MSLIFFQMEVGSLCFVCLFVIIKFCLIAAVGDEGERGGE